MEASKLVLAYSTSDRYPFSMYAGNCHWGLERSIANKSGVPSHSYGYTARSRIMAGQVLVELKRRIEYKQRKTLIETETSKW